MSVAEAENPGTIHGWGCTPTGDPPSAAVSEGQEENRRRCLPATLLRGWRRTALYCILVLLMVLVFLNIALTLWIISALKLSMSGIGPLKIIKGGIQLSGHAWVVDKLVASTIASQPSQPVTIHSHRNFTVLVSQPDQPDHAKMVIKRDSIGFRGQAFHVEDARGGTVFHASRDEVRVASEALVVDGVGGLAVKNAVQTQIVRAPPGSDLQSVGEWFGSAFILRFFNIVSIYYAACFSIYEAFRLESTTRRLDLRAPQSIHMESRAGGIDISSHSNIKMVSIVGAIKIDAPNIIIPNLREANLTSQPQKLRKIKVYQLCACGSGKLFLAAPDAPCEAREDDEELCR